MANSTENSSCFNITSCLSGKADPDPILSTASVVALTFINCLSIIPGSLGNALVLVSVATNSYLQTVPDLFIASLAFADLIVTLIQQPMAIQRIHNTYGLGATFQDALNHMGNLSLMASISSMLAVTIDRLLAIRYPFKYILIVTRTKAVYAIVGLWVFCLGVTLSLAFSSVGDQGRYFLWAYFTILLVTITIIYLYLFVVARKAENKIVTVQAQDRDENSNRNTVTNQRRERKAAKTIAIVVGVFVLFWIPFLAYTISNAASSGTPQFMRGFFWVWSISMCNSAINPYIYCARNRRYRLAFWRLLGRKVVMDDSFQSQTRPA